jgi:hypothetical protein
MRLRFLGKHSSPGNSPTLWNTDAGQYVIQGFELDPDTLAQVGDVPPGELVIRVPKELMRWDEAFPGLRAADIGATAGELTKRGVQFEWYDGMDQDEQGIIRGDGPFIPAWFKDPAGNIPEVLQER